MWLEIPTIRKTTFKVESIGIKSFSYYEERKRLGINFFRNSFISPSGEIIVVEKAWHHVEVALKIIKEIDSELQKRVDKLEHEVEIYKEILAKKGNSDLYYREKLEDAKQKLKEAKRPHVEEDFKCVNRNRGFDAGEFLIIYQGYVALSDNNVMYLSTTKEQREILNCYSEKDDEGIEILKPLNKSQLVFKTMRNRIIKEIKDAIVNNNYYSQSINSFHCPSGIPRMGWKTQKAKSDREYARVTSKRFLQKAAQYGIQFPEVEYSYFGSQINIKIDERSMLIPGFNSEFLVRQ